MRTTQVVARTSCAAMIVLSLGCADLGREDRWKGWGTSAAPVINGEDDREEWFEVEDESFRQRLRQQVAAVLWAHRVDVDVEGDRTSIKARTLRDELHVCAEERFSEQLSAAQCSATLVDDDLVLTAGHCLGPTREAAEDRCRRLSLVFGYQLSAPSELGPISASDVYRCRQVVHHEHRTLASSFRDLAWIQLDRSAAGPPAPVASVALRADSEVVLSSHGAGLPLKVEHHAMVVEVFDAEGYFRAATDSYAGGSGGALWNRELQLVGHQVRGAIDWESSGQCLRSVHSDSPDEQHQSLHVALDALCATGWPSERLCGVAPSCGDDVCTGSEDNASCPQDCPSTKCGDGRCDRAEWHACDTDCDDYSDVPLDWSSDPEVYRQLTEAADTDADDSLVDSRGVAPSGCHVHRGGKSTPFAILALAWLLTTRRRRALALRVAASRSARKRVSPPSQAKRAPPAPWRCFPRDWWRMSRLKWQRTGFGWLRS